MDMLTMKTWTESSKVLHVADLQGGERLAILGRPQSSVAVSGRVEKSRPTPFSRACVFSAIRKEMEQPAVAENMTTQHHDPNTPQQCCFVPCK